MTLKLLIVEEESSYRSIALARLSAAGFDVTTAGCATGAIKEARYTRFDGAVVDDNMPDMSGQQLALELRELAPKIKLLLIVSPSSKIEDRDSSTEVLMENWLMVATGPLHPDQILQKMSSILSDRKADDPTSTKPEATMNTDAARDRKADTRSLEEVRLSYRRKLPKELRSLKSNLMDARERPDEAEPWEAIFTITHTIHGTAGTLGLPKASEAALRIGELAKRIRRAEVSNDEDWQQVLDILAVAESDLKPKS